jgi:pimeloyl-ACP methyl ester carboxylesterase
MMNMRFSKPALRLLLGAALLFAGFAVPSALARDAKPTVVLVHGAFAGTSSWNGVIAALHDKGYRAVAVANPLRGVARDADYVARAVRGIGGPVVLVGHSYGGAVISNAFKGDRNVKALVFVGAFAPEAGESAFDLSGIFPGSTLGEALAKPVPLAGGANDLYIQQARFHAQFAADVPARQAKLMASTQRPVTDAALNEKSGPPAWRAVRSWFIYGDRDLNIPPAALGYMAERARAQETVVLKGASHALAVSQPRAVAELIDRAARHSATAPGSY